MSAPPVSWRFLRVPDDAQVEDLAAELRSALAGSDVFSAPDSLVRAFGWQYRARPIGAAGSAVQSLLVPLRKGGFSVVVNSHHHCSNSETLWLVAHEIGHSFFYQTGEPPARIVPCTQAEERFCDAFADALLRGPATRAALEVA